MRLELPDMELKHKSSKKRRRYQRRNSKVASMLAPSVTTKRSDDASIIPDSTAKKGRGSEIQSKHDEQKQNLLESLESTFEKDGSDGGSENEALDDSKKPAPS